MAATALTGASSPMASSTVTTMVPKQSQGLAASTSGISEVNYNTELGLRRPPSCTSRHGRRGPSSGVPTAVLRTVIDSYDGVDHFGAIRLAEDSSSARFGRPVWQRRRASSLCR